MNTTIVVTENIKLEYSKNHGCNSGTYSPVVFRKGGEMVRNPANGQLVESKDKWTTIPLYFTNLAHALRWCAQEINATGEEVRLEDYITRCEMVWKK